MHEFAIARNLVEAACEEARCAGALRVNRVYTRIGVWRMLESWLMQEAWVIACEGTLCEGGELLIEKIPALMECTSCGHRVALDHWPGRCPACGAEDGRLSGGDELELTKMDVDVNEENDGVASVATATKTDNEVCHDKCNDDV
jgi:hydrogenase nickel incorporation protein HypA/HybF